VPRNRSLRLAALGSTVQRAAAPGYSSSRSAGARALRRRLVAGVLVAVSLALITGYFRESESGALHDVQGVAASVLHPFQVGAERVARPFQDAYGWTAGFFHAKSENERLKVQLRELQQRVIQNEGAAQENRVLRRALKYRSGPTFPSGYEQVGAEVITFRTNEFQQDLVISAGRNDGVRTDDPVVDSSGWLVGNVSKTTRVSARVTLLTDSSFSVSGRDVQTGTIGLVSHGQAAGESLVFDLVPKDKVVRRRDLIVTAGRRSGELPSLYPRGIAIGTVTSVNQTDVDIHQTVQIAPLADFSSLNSVLVLVPKERKQ
jgi:rod shape-determining protein MreC